MFCIYFLASSNSQLSYNRNPLSLRLKYNAIFSLNSADQVKLHPIEQKCAIYGK